MVVAVARNQREEVAFLVEEADSTDRQMQPPLHSNHQQFVLEEPQAHPNHEVGEVLQPCCPSGMAWVGLPMEVSEEELVDD